MLWLDVQANMLLRDALDAGGEYAEIVDVAGIGDDGGGEGLGAESRSRRGATG